MDEINEEWIYTELKKATNDLAISTSSELKTVIGDASIDELALDFENFLTAAIPFLQDADPKGVGLLKSIDGQLEQMSGVINKHLWTERAFLEDQNWAEIRSKAEIAIRHFDWT